MRTFACICAMALLVAACGEAQPQEPVVIAQNGNCKVIRVWDDGRKVYVTDCSGGSVEWQTQEYCGKACTRTLNHSSVTIPAESR